MRIIALLAFAMTLCAPAQGSEICTLVTKARTGETVFERGDCDTPVTPASTFKMALAVMGFEAGFLKSADAPVLSFQAGDPDWVAAWKQDTNPKQWMIESNLWYSQRIAHALGAKAFSGYLARFDYGNADASGDAGQNNGLKRSWVSSSLKIAPREQARFMRDLLSARLPVSREAQAQALGLIQKGGEVNDWTVWGKTGSAYPRKADQSFDYARGWGWYVGWAQRGDDAYVIVRLNQENQRRSGSIGILARDALLEEMKTMPVFNVP